MAGNGDLKAHEDTYSNVMVFLKWGTIVSAIVAAFVIFIIQ
jgi:hypothetical protein